MFRYEKTVSGNIDTGKLWQLYSQVSRWKEWDADIQDAVLNGAFVPGSSGVMSMKNGPSLPFVLDHVEQGKAFTVVSRLGPISVALLHTFTQASITHTVTVSGGTQEESERIGRTVTANLPHTLDQLLSMVAQP